MELRLASTYTESKANLLNDVLEEFFFDDGSFWEAAPLPSGVRDVTYELINTMVGCKQPLPAWNLVWRSHACSMQASSNARCVNLHGSDPDRSPLSV